SAPAEPSLAAAGAQAAAGALGSGVLGLLRGVGRGLPWIFGQRDVQRLAALGILAGVFCGTSQLVAERVQTSPDYALPSRLVAEVAPPPGLSVKAAEDLSSLRLVRGAHAFDARIVPAVARQLGRLPWVEQVSEVELEPPAKIRFRLRPHQPLARLGDQLAVSRSGATFPIHYAAAGDALPEFRGVPATPEARAKALQAGAQVLADFGPLAAQVEAIDVSNLAGAVDPLQSEVVVLLSGGLKVEWGRANLDEERQDRPAEQKRADLEAFLAAYPQRGRVESVSVRWDEVTFVLAEEQSLASAGR
ncbi:MAG TPA: hypothetical protein DEA08_01385, partial [Planctomycetes bacterium]|nr:hypothetical protein [Planctomycetota bacterium]